MLFQIICLPCTIQAVLQTQYKDLIKSDDKWGLGNENWLQNNVSWQYIEVGIFECNWMTANTNTISTTYMDGNEIIVNYFERIMDVL